MADLYSFLVLNGPNLNLLGRRRPDLYGSQTLAEVEDMARGWARQRDHQVRCMQSNHEGVLIDELHAAIGRYHGVIFNPGGYSHTSVALRDAVEAIAIPVVEVHLTKIEEREAFRRMSFISDVALSTITGRGAQGYLDALDLLQSHLQR